ncbi:MAG TPA: Spy/CpxP family protein refolding chaperone [Steroidobacteraceae bacterium]|nr:Spy/CpxP family protein refolding chaperone [Steroidobacteraceae bacterium]
MKVRVALMATALLASAVARAGPHGGHAPDMDRMATLLDLNDSQKAEVQKILSEQHAKAKAAHEERRAAGGEKPTRDERAKLHEEMKQETTTKLQAVLTPEQIKKFEALTDHRGHGRHGDRH